MFEYYQNHILCVHASWIIEQKILTESNYKQLAARGHLNKLTTGGNGRKALIQLDTMRSDLKTKVIEKANALGLDPYAKFRLINFANYIEHDVKAYNFYRSYTLDNDDALPLKTVTEYCQNASVLNAISKILKSKPAQRKALTGDKMMIWDKIAKAVENLPKHTYPHTLPTNHRRLKDKFKQYLNEGYEVFIHKSFGSKNAEKLNDDAKSFVFARWCDRVKRVANYNQLLREYNQEATQQGWKMLKSEQSLINFLTDPKVESVWYGIRFGDQKAKEKYSFQFATIMPTMRDSLWYSDGTKLNFYYRDENGKPQTMQVYEVMDAYSEVFLGYHISKTEDYRAQYQAYKMAIKISGHRPYQISFDNQGGHKKLESGNFLNKIAHLAIKTQPYNGKSKTIESAFGRFQQQYLKQHWFFTGQNITAKKEESKANMEFILANIANLPTLNEIQAVYEQCRQEWNAAINNKTGKARIDMYYDSFNDKAPEISLFEMVDFFWVERKKPITCTASGISFTEKGIEYQYVVYDKDTHMPDLVWLRQNVDKKFYIKFDPDDMSLIYLYDKTPLGLRLVGGAETKIQTHRGKQEQEAWEAQYLNDIIEKNKVLRIEARDQANLILEKHQMRAVDYGLKEPRLKGIESSRKQKTAKTDIAQYQKKLSNVVLTEAYQEVDFTTLM